MENDATLTEKYLQNPTLIWLTNSINTAHIIQLFLGHF